MQRTANENAACLRRICKRSDQPKIERIANNDARLILRKYSLRHRKCGVRGFIHELFVSKTRTSEVRASEGF